MNLGGGFGIPYFDGTLRSSSNAIAERTSPSLVDSRIRPNLPEAQIVIELGRYIVGECGVYVTRVVDRKVSRGRIYLVVDGGMHHQLAASGNFGQAIRRNYPIVVGNRAEPAESRRRPWSAACVPRSTCWVTTCKIADAESEIRLCCFRRAPTA